MGLKLVMNILPIFLFFSSASARRELLDAGDFDVTSAKYGAKPNSDITEAFTKAFTDACASTTLSKIVVPAGKFLLKEAEFKGPCKAPIEFQVQGTIQAPEEAKDLTNPDTWVSFNHIDKLTLSGGGTFDGNGALSWKNNDCNKNTKCAKVVNLRFNFLTNSVIQDITCMNSKHFQINVLGGNNVTLKLVKVSAPAESVNTDGIHIGKSTGVSILDSVIGTGDDCVSIGDGNKQITVTNLTCGPGHGIAIGSLGRYEKEEPVEGINVKNCTISNTSNGVRIKTWPASPQEGAASDIHFEDIIMNNVSTPILIDQEYCPYNQCTNQVPSKVKLSKISFKNIKGTSNTPLAVKLVCSKGVPCEGVELSGIDLKYTGDKGAITSQCTNVKPTITNVAQPLACATDAPVPADKAGPAEKSAD